MPEFINCPACCSKQCSLVKVQLEPFLGMRLKAYWGEVVQLHTMTLALDGGE